MPDRDPRRLAAWAVAALALLLLSAWYVTRSRPSADAAPPPAAAIDVDEGDGGSGRVMVDVAGAVHRPGVYRLSSNARVEDALQRAGGATRRADLGQVNRAAKLEDGRQILVPVRPPRELGHRRGRGSRARCIGVRRRRPGRVRHSRRVCPRSAAQPQHGDARATGHARRRRPGHGAEDPRLPHRARRLRQRRRARSDSGHRREAPRGDARARCGSRGLDGARGARRRARRAAPASARPRRDRRQARRRGARLSATRGVDRGAPMACVRAGRTGRRGSRTSDDARRGWRSLGTGWRSSASTHGISCSRRSWSACSRPPPARS